MKSGEGFVLSWSLCGTQRHEGVACITVSVTDLQKDVHGEWLRQPPPNQPHTHHKQQQQQPLLLYCTPQHSVLTAGQQDEKWGGVRGGGHILSLYHSLLAVLFTMSQGTGHPTTKTTTITGTKAGLAGLTKHFSFSVTLSIVPASPLPRIRPTQPPSILLSSLRFPLLNSIVLVRGTKNSSLRSTWRQQVPGCQTNRTSTAQHSNVVVVCSIGITLNIWEGDRTPSHLKNIHFDPTHIYHKILVHPGLFPFLGKLIHSTWYSNH